MTIAPARPRSDRRFRPLFRSLAALTASLAVTLGLAGCAPKPLACTAARDVQADQLHGQWTVQLGDSRSDWALQLAPHPEHRGSLRGELAQGLLRYPVVADLANGEFTMEESHDGRRIAATWLGDVASGSCGRLVLGERLSPGQATQTFRLQR